MKTTPEGRPFCDVRDVGGSEPVLHVHPELYDVLRSVVDGRMTCTVELAFKDGGLGGTHVRIAGRKLAGVVRERIVTGATCTP